MDGHQQASHQGAWLGCPAGFAAEPLGANTPIGADVELKRILMLQSFGFRFKPWADYAETFRSEMIRQVGHC